MVLKVPLYLSIEGLDYEDLSLEDFKFLQENLTGYYTDGINSIRSHSFSDKGLIEVMTDFFEENPKHSVQRFLENSKRTSKKKILSIPRLINREEALEHLRKDLA